MKTTIIATALCLIGGGTLSAQAGGSHEQPHGQPHGGGGQPSYNASATNNVAALAGARSSAVSGSRSGANATTGPSSARTGSSRASTGAVTVNNTTEGYAQSPSYSGGNYTNNYSARGNTPDVILGSVSGGNPCGLGAGGGLSVQSAGALFQKMWEGDGCQTNEDAKLLYNVGLNSVAKERLCESTYYSNAFARAGQPCAADVQRWRAAGYRPVNGGWVR